MSEIFSGTSLTKVWVNNNYPEITEALSEGVNKLVASGSVDSENIQDPHSLPVCFSLMSSLPDNLIGQIRRRVLIVSLGEKTIGHCCLEDENVIIDPTFGQFLDLDEAIQQRPDLFVNRVLVSTRDEVHSQWGIKYSD